MRKGLKSTLLTVAVALLGFNAMAMAPVISNIQDVIIGDAESSSASNDFTFPDAFNAGSKVSDDNTADANIKWTFQNAGGHYSINGKTRTDGSAANLDAPSATYSLTEGADDAASVDTDLQTLTFRNIQFSPPGGPNTEPGNPGVVSDGQAVTLVASDGTTHTMSNVFMVYILNDGFDALSGGGGSGVNVLSVDWTDGQPHGWVQYTIVVADGGVVTLSNNANGLCADASAQGTNLSGWASQANYTGSNATYNTIALANNAVYQTRVTVSTTAQAGRVPLWYVNFQNTLDWYGGTYIFFDNGVNPTAGNNAPAPAGTRSEFVAYLNAPGAGTATFQTEVGNAANATFHDFRLALQVLDIGVTGNDPYGGAGDSGAVCWRKIEVNRFDAGDYQSQSTPYNVTNITQPVNAPAGTQNSDPNAVAVADFSGAGVATVTYAGGDVTLAPTSASAWQTNSAFFIIQPGDATNSFNGSADMIDNYPATFGPDEVIKIVYTLQAPSALAETNGPDYFYLGGDVPTNDIITNTYQTTKLNQCGMPKQTAQEFFSFYATNGGTSATGNFARMRPHMFTGTVPAFVDVQNQAGVTVNAIRVEKGTF